MVIWDLVIRWLFLSIGGSVSKGFGAPFKGFGTSGTTTFLGATCFPVNVSGKPKGHGLQRT